MSAVWTMDAKDTTPVEASNPSPADFQAGLPDARILADRIARRYGSEAFHRVASLRFTFHLRFKEHDIEREWTWFPKQDSVNYRGPDAKGVVLQAAYSRRNAFSLGTDQVAAIDKAFINDQYWLLFPLHLKWDKDLTLKVARAVKPGEAWHLMVMYPSKGGYTPGDAYDLFVDSSDTIKRWIFRKGNAAEPTREAFWSAPVETGGLGISMEHPAPDPDFHLWYTDVKVSLGPT
ncbi:MAG: hypothetical protein ABIW76_07090 [Fibrobacteria bacterium]